MMNEQEIRKYASLMNELELTGLEITEGESTVRLERGSGAAASVQTVAVPAVAVPDNNSVSKELASDCVSVKSPLVGVFYAAPAENADPFVAIGDRVEKGKTLCIVEAMKMMNEICADEDGVVCEICVTNGQVVEFGTELFKIKK